MTSKQTIDFASETLENRTNNFSLNFISLFYNPAFGWIWFEFDDDNCRFWLVRTIDKLLKSFS